MRTRTLLVLMILTTPVLRGDGCGEPLTRNSAFDLWCEGQLCGWEVEEGTVTQAPTWHRADYGVGLNDDHVRFSQKLNRAPRCLQFSALADVPPDATVTVGLDFFDDGTVDYTFPIAGPAWTRSVAQLTPPRWYEGLRLIVEKTGPGQVVLAELSLENELVDACTGPPIEVQGATPGTPCSVDATCAGGGHCGPSDARGLGTRPVLSCGTCISDADCTGGAVCGLTADSERLPYATCQVPGLDPLGEACSAGAECASGVCCGGACSTCCEGGPGCAMGEACTQAAQLDPIVELRLALLRSSWRCAAEQGQRLAGEPCTVGADCSSGTCTGTTAVMACVSTGRSCGEGDACSCIDLGAPGVCR